MSHIILGLLFGLLYIMLSAFIPDGPVGGAADFVLRFTGAALMFISGYCLRDRERNKSK